MSPFGREREGEREEEEEMIYIKIHDPELYMECHESWDRHSTIYDCVKGVGPAKAELIKKIFLKYEWLVWFCHKHPEQTAKFIANLYDTYGKLTNKKSIHRLGEKLAWNIVNYYSGKYPPSSDPFVACWGEPMMVLQGVVGIIHIQREPGYGGGGAWEKVLHFP